MVLIVSVGLLVFGTLLYLLLAYTPLNHIFPTKSSKYSNIEQYEMLQRIDSLEHSLTNLKLQSDILNQILEGEDVNIDVPLIESPETSTETEEIAGSGSGTQVKIIRSSDIDPKSYNLFLPLKGVVSDTFNIDRKHLAVDIAAKSKEVIKSVQKGTVIFSDWTPGGGHTLVIQHPNELISVYKHNAVLLKKEGTFVNAGDAIALVGNTGELSSGPHLHFELWSKGIAVNPQDYINF
jgi:murein DD-endopeptidase MepM/ murein hydrolase activator NlpD